MIHVKFNSFRISLFSTTSNPDEVSALVTKPKIKLRFSFAEVTKTKMVTGKEVFIDAIFFPTNKVPWTSLKKEGFFDDHT